MVRAGTAGGPDAGESSNYFFFSSSAPYVPSFAPAHLVAHIETADIDFLLFVRVTRRATTLFERMDSTHDHAHSTPLVDMLQSRYESRFSIQYDPRFLALLRRITLGDRNASGERLLRLCQHDTIDSDGGHDIGGTYGVSYVLESGSTTIGKTTNFPPPIDTRDARS